MTHLDEVLALGLGHQWLKLGSRERVDETGFRYHQQQDLGAREDREFIGLDATALEWLAGGSLDATERRCGLGIDESTDGDGCDAMTTSGDDHHGRDKADAKRHPKTGSRLEGGQAKREKKHVPSS